MPKLRARCDNRQALPQVRVVLSLALVLSSSSLSVSLSVWESWRHALMGLLCFPSSCSCDTAIQQLAGSTMCAGRQIQAQNASPQQLQL